MTVVYILIALVVGFVLGHFIWPKFVKEIVRVNVDVPVEKIVKEEVVVHPEDWKDYLQWKEHKEDFEHLNEIIPDEVIQDDEKFEKVMAAIESCFTVTDGGELGTSGTKTKKKKNNN